jgi:tryptophan synthase alpha subunit
VVGSAVVKLIEKYGKQKRVFKEVGDFVKGLKMAMGVDQ